MISKSQSIKNEKRLPVSIVRNNGNLKKAISDSLHLIDFQLSKKDVFIKPNLVTPAKYDSGIITDPAVVGALADVLREEYHAEDITIGEGPQIGCSVKDCFELGGYNKVAKEHDLKLLDLNLAERTGLPWKYGTIQIPMIIQKCFYINMPKIKTHTQTTVTLSLKNQKGLLTAGDKKNFHRLDLHEHIVELYRIIKPDLVVVDGLVALEGDGPAMGGKIRQLDLVVAGKDALKVDNVCCKIMGIPPSEIKHIKLANEFFGNNETETIKGLQICELNINKFKRANERLKKIGKIYYWRNSSACTMCSESLYQAIKEMKEKPALFLEYGPHVFYHLLFKRLDFLAGKDAEIPSNCGDVCCIGNCLASLAEKNNLRLVEGCPPKPLEILKKL